MSEIHVLGIVGNDILNDNRVKKVAASSAAAGYRTTIVCYASGPARRTSKMGDVEVVRLPIPFHVRDRYRRVNGPARAINGHELNGRHLGIRTVHLAEKRRLQARAAAGEDVRAAMFAHRVRMFARRYAFLGRVRMNTLIDRVKRRVFLTQRRAANKYLARFHDQVGHLLDYEVGFGPEIVDQKPDLIHAHDYHMIGVAVNAARFLRAEGHDTKVVYDAHELVEGLSYPQAMLDGWLAEEGAYIGEVDAVTGVSQEQVERIAERYGLAEVPKVVMNAPLRIEREDDGPTLSDEIDADHILVYHGNIAEERGVFTLVDALEHLDDGVHVAFVAPPTSPVRQDIIDRADERGLSARVHVLDFVSPEKLERYLESGAIAVIPYHHTGNNDIALPNKLFESIQAGLPILASDMRALSRFLAESGVGEVFASEDARDLAAKAQVMLDDLATYQAAVTPQVREQTLWDAQADTLLGVYERLVGRPESTPERASLSVVDIREARPESTRNLHRGTKLVIGPRNMAGQAHQIARAVEREYGIEAMSCFLDAGTAYRFPVDQIITREDWYDPAWQQQQVRLLGATASHVLTESGTGIYGALNGGFVDEQLAAMRHDDLAVGVVFHGSEIRDPRRHRHLPFSPYATDEQLIRDLEAATERLRSHLEPMEDVPYFVTTPDLLADVEGATWLPVVIDVDEWDLDEREPTDKPVVLHMPTNGLLKGSGYVDEVLFALQEEGVIDYLRPTDPMQPHEVAASIQAADMVVDGVVLGAYGVMSCQVMAAGRLALANLDQLGDLRAECPIIDVSPSTMEERIRELAADRDGWNAVRDAGRAFVREYHDGRHTARQLSDFLGA